ncbi:MAG: ribosome-associated protein [Azospira oryzae]|nr:MAG: ribosome-associated protein [Azospira oryzae]PZP80016.1 MAG: ribosome-associated protein [Azospira oryzae]
MDQELSVSKTKRKQRMHELQALGETLTRLSEAQLAALAIPESLRDAVREAKRIRSFEAQRRQIQYIGRLMREVDDGLIREQLAVWQGSAARHTAWLHTVERWRARLIESDAALTEIKRAYPAADTGRLRALARNVRIERETGKPPRAFRALFQELKRLIPAPDIGDPSHAG